MTHIQSHYWVLIHKSPSRSPRRQPLSTHEVDSDSRVGCQYGWFPIVSYSMYAMYDTNSLMHFSITISFHTAHEFESSNLASLTLSDPSVYRIQTNSLHVSGISGLTEIQPHPDSCLIKTAPAVADNRMATDWVNERVFGNCKGLWWQTYWIAVKAGSLIFSITGPFGWSFPTDIMAKMQTDYGGCF